jgi:hypothetical protein
MATTQMTTDNALTVKLWAKLGFVDMYKNTAFGRMAQRGTIRKADELSRAMAGDEVTFNFTGILTGIGTGEGGTQQGNEEALDNQAFTMKFNVFRHAVSSPNDGTTIEGVRSMINFEDRARELLPAFHASRLDASVFNQLAGVDSTTIITDGTVYSGSDKQYVQGLNAVNAPTANRIIRAGGAPTDEALTSADTFTLDLVDAALEQLLRTYPYAGSIDDEFDLYISYEQETDLKRDTSGKITWYGNYLSGLAGGMIADNPIMTGSEYGTKPIGKYANVNIIPCSRVATGVDSVTNAAIPTVKRAVLCGKNALAFASKFGGDLKDGKADDRGNVPMIFETELSDYNYIKGIEARMIYGVKKMQFDSEDYGSSVISTYAAAHTS